MKREPSYADDCEAVIRILADAVSPGLTQEQIADKLTTPKRFFGYRRTNDVLTDLALKRRVVSERAKQPGSTRKVTVYRLRPGA
jgi:hypothetical protein